MYATFVWHSLSCPVRNSTIAVNNLVTCGCTIPIFSQLNLGAVNKFQCQIVIIMNVIVEISIKERMYLAGLIESVTHLSFSLLQVLVDFRNSKCVKQMSPVLAIEIVGSKLCTLFHGQFLVFGYKQFHVNVTYQLLMSEYQHASVSWHHAFLCTGRTLLRRCCK